MNESDVFLKEPGEYKRELDVLGTAQRDAAHYLRLRSGDTYEECLSFVKAQTSDNEGIEIKALVKQGNGDRAKSTMSVGKLLKQVSDNGQILTPNLVVYKSHKDEESFTGDYCVKKMAERSIVKKLVFKAKANNDGFIETFNENKQVGIKTLTNSVSGAHASYYNILWNKTAHSSLTSTCRTITSYSNGVTERLVSGNRHYYSYEVIINHIASSLALTQTVKLNKVIDKYKLTIPTVSDVMSMINRCTELYWYDTVKTKKILSIVEKMSPLERASFYYTGDLYHLRLLNESLLKELCDGCIIGSGQAITDEEAILEIESTSSDVITLVTVICSDVLKGRAISDIKESYKEGYRIVAQTIRSVSKMFIHWYDLIEVLFACDSVPMNIYEFPTSIRRSTIGSDTDSTMFTVQEWVKWYFGDVIFSNKGNSIANIIVYFNVQAISHVLAIISRQLGAPDKYLYSYKMKNEFSMLIYIYANRAKHYITYNNRRESNMYRVPELDVKGVGLKDSKLPDVIVKGLHNEMVYIMERILHNKGIDSDPLKQRIANLEHSIFRSLASGEGTYYKNVNINPKEAYKLPDSSNYLHYDLWSTVFAVEYGECDSPPYRAIKIPVTLTNKRKLDEWVNTLPLKVRDLFIQWNRIDVTIEVPDNIHTSTDKEEFMSWCDGFKTKQHPILKAWFKLPVTDRPKVITGTYPRREYLNMILIPSSILSNGIPDIFITVIDSRHIVSELMACVYIFLECCGFYYSNKNNTRLLSDEVKERPESLCLGELNAS